MRRTTMVTIATILLMAAVCCWFVGATAAAPDEKATVAATIHVMGHGKAAASPDTASVQVGIHTEAATAAGALSANSAAMEKLLDTLKRAGIDERDLQTVNFNVSPRYRQPRPGSDEPETTIIGYQVSNSVRATVRKLSNLGQVLDQAVSAGSNQIYGISFTVEKPDSVLDDARRQAVGDAVRKAGLYAEAAGVRVGRLLRISEPGTIPLPVPQFERAMPARAMSVPVEPGEQEFSAQVELTFEIQP